MPLTLDKAFELLTLSQKESNVNLDSDLTHSRYMALAALLRIKDHRRGLKVDFAALLPFEELEL